MPKNKDTIWLIESDDWTEIYGWAESYEEGLRWITINRQDDPEKYNIKPIRRVK